MPYARTLHILEELIAHDPQNFDYIQKRLEVEYRYADEQLVAGDVDAARRTYQRAFERAEPVARSKRQSLHTKAPPSYGGRTAHRAVRA